ncbi:hypothetical protein OXYTRIMIC_691 [Oxytricha trifallax]|uniref:Uncharacterized protein n=1 Tax=Oxytricha trifallax TaxID=1172189 RepID=A0A073HZP4_9SPIT|nr:hypothetical protein OXYTRIMIC_691 [Oxytricha trifallax]
MLIIPESCLKVLEPSLLSLTHRLQNIKKTCHRKSRLWGYKEQRMDWLEEIIQNIILQIFNRSYCVAIQLFEENPFIPYTFDSHFKRFISNANSTELQKCYDEVVKLKLAIEIKTNDPRKTQDDLRALYQQIKQQISKI